MDPSKELDEIFRKMKQVGRTDEARKTSFVKLQHKMKRKKNVRLAPAFISVAMLAIVFIFAFTFFNGDSLSENDVASGTSGIDKNEAVIREVLEKEFTGPDEEYIRLMQRMFQQQKGDMTEEEYNAFQKSSVVQDFTSYEKAKYAGFFTENGLDRFINSGLAFIFSSAEGDHQISLGEVEITRNENNPALYQFAFTVNFESGSGEKEQFALEGDAIVPEEGKIGKFNLSAGVEQLSEKLSGNKLN
ncbi:hypothetical protein [Planococcus sp. YIM B11945]|uniref:hypothetical protein n=1 Tax=Planococcus sp. YIM B11945 TaxID=3435410 RepID=UPI003D7E53EC